MSERTALERQQAAFRNEFTVVRQAMIELFLPTIKGVGLETMSAAQLNHWRAGLPLLQDGELLLGGNAAASTALDGWIRILCLNSYSACMYKVEDERRP
jgi:hypothetical protein